MENLWRRRFLKVKKILYVANGKRVRWAKSYSQKNKVLFYLPPSSTFSPVDSSKMTLKSICTPKLETLLIQTLLFHVGYYDIDISNQGNNQLDL